jgi:hypothetical protein
MEHLTARIGTGGTAQMPLKWAFRAWSSACSARGMLRIRHLLSSLIVLAVACGGRAATVDNGPTAPDPGDPQGDKNGWGGSGGGNNDHEQDDLADASHVDANVDTKCGDQICHHGDACVVTMSGGGPCMPPDDTNMCPDGKPPEGACCNRTTTTYACKALPASCGGVLSCPCAASLCECGGCGLAEQPNTLSCGCFYP